MGDIPCRAREDLLFFRTESKPSTARVSPEALHLKDETSHADLGIAPQPLPPGGNMLYMARGSPQPFPRGMKHLMQSKG